MCRVTLHASAAFEHRVAISAHQGAPHAHYSGAILCGFPRGPLAAFPPSPKVADGEKTAEQIGLDRDVQRDNIAALSRDIAAVKQREDASEKARKKAAERTRLSDAKAAVRTGPGLGALEVGGRQGLSASVLANFALPCVSQDKLVKHATTVS